MKKEEQTTFETFWGRAQKGMYFLFLLFMKMLEKAMEKSEKTVPQNTGKEDKSFFHLLFKSVYRKIKDGQGKGKDKKKQAPKTEVKKKKAYKTWARVKQDFREYYQTLKEDFEKETVDSPLENEDKENKTAVLAQNDVDTNID